MKPARLTSFTARKRFLCGLAIVLSAAQALPVMAAPSQLPLLTRSGNPAKPNVMFTLDDSGSMRWRFMPDEASPFSSSGSNWGVKFVPGDPTPGQSNSNLFTTRRNDLLSSRLRSSAWNKVYYDPNVRYLPWFNSDGTRFPDSPPDHAWHNPMDQGTVAGGKAVSLTVFDAAITASTRFCRSNNTNTVNDSVRMEQTTATCSNLTGERFTPATYYEYNGQGTGTTLNFTRVRITDPAVTTFSRTAARTDCTVSGSAATCTQAQELQNFANWYTYYRSRLYLAIAAASQAFAAQGDGIRLGYGSINQGAPIAVDGVATTTIVRGVRVFSGPERDAFFTWLHGITADGGTPLRRAMGDVGEYYRRTDDQGPWGNTPGSVDTTAHLECRKAFHILTTDGYWNGAGASNSGATGNVDNTAGERIPNPNAEPYQYVPTAPYQDSYSGTLADVAMYYWVTDLRPDLDNRVPTDDVDKAGFWQHMVNFTVGLGVGGSRDPSAGLPSDWPEPVADTSTTVDDLWHAAVNSRGKFLSAAKPDEFAAALSGMLQEITRREASEAGVAAAATTLQANNRKYVPTYTTADWSGDLSAYTLDVLGQESGAPIWKASEHLPAFDQRNIWVWKDSASTPRAIPFTWADLQNNQMSAELGPTGSSNLVSYLRGDRSAEGRAYRARAGLLGDIVNSQPVFVKDLVDMQYGFLPPGTPGRDTYRQFLASKKRRTGVIAVGANDGMLHLFSDTDGHELFAFVPRTLLPSLGLLAANSYGHRYYVDGPLTESDAYLGGAWRNVLVGATGAGARAVFALDVTSTSSMGASNVSWEINSGNDSDLGYVLAPAEVGLLKNGDWVAVFGNGYSSDSGSAVLFMVNLGTGAIRKIDTRSGPNNGLGGVRVIRDMNNVIVGAYAGDLKGNLWKFDMTSTSPSDWAVGFGGNPFFATPQSSPGVPQPIVAAPEFVTHPMGGLMVLVGTGKLFEEGDATSRDPQSIYGLWDRAAVGTNSMASDRITSQTSIVAQSVDSTPVAGAGGSTFFTITATPLDWSRYRGWSLPLSMFAGQRMVDTPQLVSGFALFETVSPIVPGSSNQCVPTDGVGVNFLLNPLNGAMPLVQVFDTNGDGVVNSSDRVVGAYQTRADGRDVILTRAPGSGMAGGGGGGGGNPPAVCAGRSKVYSIQSSQGQTPACLTGAATDRSWRQIINPPR